MVACKGSVVVAWRRGGLRAGLVGVLAALAMVGALGGLWFVAGDRAGHDAAGQADPVRDTRPERHPDGQVVGGRGAGPGDLTHSAWSDRRGGVGAVGVSREPVPGIRDAPCRWAARHGASSGPRSSPAKAVPGSRWLAQPVYSGAPRLPHHRIRPPGPPRRPLPPTRRRTTAPVRVGLAGYWEGSSTFSGWAEISTRTTRRVATAPRPGGRRSRA